MSGHKHVLVESSRIALRALARPQSLAAIGLLLLNDHILKGLFPGVITGKLSDIAGLAFFPLLLALVLGLLFRKPGSTLLVSSVVTGICFTAIKTIPAAAAVAEQLMSPIWPWRIIVDPTDLIALPSIPIAGVAWRSAQARPKSWWSSRRPRLDPQVVAVTVAALASFATGACQASDGVQFVERDGVLLVAADGSGRYIAASQDDGRTWMSGIVRSGQRGDLEGERVTEDCFVDRPDHCFRIDGGAYVEESVDGGASWVVAWQLPPGREGFLERPDSACDFYAVSAVDLFIAESPNQLVLVAMSNDGLLRLNESGTWERDILGMAAPLAATNERISQEYFAALALMMTATLVFTRKALRLLRTEAGPRIGAWPVAGSVTLGVAAALTGLRALMVNDDLFVPILTFVVIVIGLVGLAGPLSIWANLSTTRPGTTAKFGLLTAVGIIALGAAVVVPFVAWSGGGIANWETAAAIAGVGATAVFAITWWGLSKVKADVDPQPPNSFN